MTQDDVVASTDPSARSAGPSYVWWRALAVISAAALVAGAVGYTIGHTTAEPATAAPAITLPGGLPVASNGVGPGVIGAPEPAPLGDPRGGMDLMPYGYERIVFTSSGLADEPDATTAWAYDPAQAFSKQVATHAAAALGLDDDPALVNGSWVVGPTDGTGPALQLTPDGVASLTYYDPSMDPYRCEVPALDYEGEGDTSDGSTRTGSSGGGTSPGSPGAPVVPPSTGCGQSTQPSPQGDDAVDRVDELLVSLGVDTSGYEFDSADFGTPNASTVTAYQVVEGQRTGGIWNATLIGSKIQSLSGGLAPLVSLGSYTVVSPTSAVDRLSDPRYITGYFGGPLPYAAESSLTGAADVASANAEPAPDIAVAPTPTLPPTVETGDRFSWPVQEVTITKARLGLALYYQADGATVLLPTYELSNSDGQMWSVVAVDDESLNFDD